MGLVELYRRLISPLFPSSCRYFPSCSEYAVQALTRHGLLRGLWLATARVVRCNPWSDGGMDPVPRTALKRDCPAVVDTAARH